MSNNLPLKFRRKKQMKREREKIFDAICIWRRSFCRSTRTRGGGKGVRGVDIVWGMFYIFLYKFWCWFWFVPCNFAALSCSCRWLICFAKWRTTWRDFVDCFALPGSGEGGTANDMASLWYGQVAQGLRGSTKTIRTRSDMIQCGLGMFCICLEMEFT